MNFRECTEEYLELKKEQYYKVANYIFETINKANLSNCKASFEMIKDMLINNEGLSFWKNLIDAYIWQLQMLLPWIPVIVTVLSSIVIAIVSDDVSVFKTKGFWLLILAIFVGGLLLDVGIRTFTIRTENMYFRFLKEMTYEQYVFILDEFKNHENTDNCKDVSNQKEVRCTWREKLYRFFYINKIILFAYIVFITTFNMLNIISTFSIPTYIQDIVYIFSFIIAVGVSIYRYINGTEFFNALCYLVIEKCKLKDQYERCSAIEECVRSYKKTNAEVNETLNITTIEAAIAHDETMGVIIPIFLTAISLFFSKAEPIFLLSLALWIFTLILNLVFVLPRNAFIKKVVTGMKKN